MGQPVQSFSSVDFGEFWTAACFLSDEHLGGVGDVACHGPADAFHVTVDEGVINVEVVFEAFEGAARGGHRSDSAHQHQIALSLQELDGLDVSTAQQQSAVEVTVGAQRGFGIVRGPNLESSSRASRIGVLDTPICSPSWLAL